MTATIGTDPEYLLQHEGKLVSAIGKIQGNKEERICRNGHQIFYDNVLAEIAIKPAKEKNEFNENVRSGLQELMKIIAPYEICLQAAGLFSDADLADPEAHKIACDPETCAYSLEEEKPDKFPSNYRTAGGHIHVGHPEIVKGFNRVFTIRMMDLFVGIPSVLLDKDETSVFRRSIYGMPGRYRKTTYGIEYRTLSNFWTKSPLLTEWIYDASQFVVEFVLAKKHLQFWTVDIDKMYDSDWLSQNHPRDCHNCHGYNVDAVRDTIVNSDEAAAKELMKFIEPLMSPELSDQLNWILSKDYGTLNEEWSL